LLNEDPEAQQAASAGIFQSTINNQQFPRVFLEPAGLEQRKGNHDYAADWCVSGCLGWHGLRPAEQS
jgi:hypothetical protein